MTVGVPQGSISGPFFIYINEVHKSFRYASIALFADDTALSYWSPTDLKNIACWLEENKLTLNTSKSKFMLIANSKKLKNVSHFKLTINICTLERESTLKYLGIAINEHISWADHIDFATKKVKSKIWRSAQDFKVLTSNLCS